MPDLVTVITRRWKLIAALTLTATLLSFLVSLFIPKKYLGDTTALTANPALSDKARLFNRNIEALYTELGSPDDLDRIEGTAKLDTLYLALSGEFNLIAHYSIDNSDPAALYKAAERLQKNTTINRTGYGELRIKVWDKNSQMAAALANAAMQMLNNIHQQLLTENNRLILQRLKEEYMQMTQALKNKVSDTSSLQPEPLLNTIESTPVLKVQMAQYAQLINEYELALKTTPKVLLVVQYARPAPWPDKPKIFQIVVIAFFAALLFSVLLIFFAESRNPYHENHQP